MHDTLICSGNPSPTGTVSLTTGLWYPIIIEHSQGNAGESMVMSFKRTGNQTYSTLSCTTHANGVLFVYDEKEMPCHPKGQVSCHWNVGMC